MTQGKLGARLRQLRLETGMSVRTLAARSGFSPSFISQVESDLVSPSIASLEKIAGQLGVTLGQLFSSLENVPRVLVRSTERVTYRSDWSHSIVEAVSDTAPDRRLSGILVTFNLDGSSGKRLAPALQDTLVFIISGSVTFTLETESHELAAGDTIYLQEGDTFMVHNHNPSPATLLLVSPAGRHSLNLEPGALPEDERRPPVVE